MTCARAEHVYVDVPAPPHHRHNRHRPHRAHHRQHAHAHAHRRAASSSATASLLKYYFSRGQRAATDDLDADAESEPSSYFDVVSACKRRLLAPLVGKLRGVKSAHEIEVMKSSAEISARAHAKVSVGCIGGVPGVAGWLADARERNRRCALLSTGSPKLIFRRTLSIYARGAVRSVLRTSPSSHLGKRIYLFPGLLAVF